MRNWIMALSIGLSAGLVCALFQSAHPISGTDMLWSVDAAQDLLVGRRLYTTQTDPGNIPYPLPAVLVALPFVALPRPMVGPLFMALSSALLAWAIVRRGEWWRLLLFVSPAYVMSLMLVQWAPLLCAVALLPALAPLALCKPTLGGALVLSQLTWRRALACAAFGALTLLVDPTWPLRWYQQTRGYYGFVPLLLLPLGPLLVLAAVRWRDRAGQWLLLLACVPQQLFFYDALPLWLVSTRRRPLLALTFCSWLAFLGLNALSDFRSGAQAILIGCYLPALGMLLAPSLAGARRSLARRELNGTSEQASR